MSEITMEESYLQKEEEVVDQLNVNKEQGLSDEEVKKRQKEYGLNQLEEKKDKSIFQLVIDQVNTPVVYLLVAAAALSFAFGDIPEGIAIVVVILINAAIGFWMEFQAMQSMKALKEMDKIQAKVLRNGESKNVDAEQLVPGDILILEAGDLIPADARLIESSETEINESSLTGESVPVEKNARTMEEEKGVADRKNMIFKGTAMTRGKAVAVVTGTGMNTELGNISEMVSSAQEESIPLNEKLHRLTKKLIWIVLGMAALLGLTGTVTDKDIYTIIQTAIAWAIAAIPEGLPIVASIALAKGMLRLAKHNVVVKRLASVEALGETNVIFTDKTGTLTENKLTVNEIVLPGQHLHTKWQQNKNSVSISEGEDIQNRNLEMLLKISVLCNDAKFNEEDEAKSEGDPLEIALLKFASFFNKEKKEEWQKQEKVSEDPFDSESKMMGTITKDNDHYFIAGKGAASSIFDISTKILVNDEVKELTSDEKDKWLNKNDELSNNGLRTLAFAYKQSTEKPIEDEFLHDLVLVGLIGFLDPPQKDVKDAILNCKEAGIDVIMVTGDHPGTASNIAHQVGLTDNQSDKIINGSDLTNNSVSDEEITNAKIFSRVSPEQKYTIVEKFKNQGKIVGMTGDGVNDAPALKKADIGIAMGLRGTQVAKEVADMVLKDDAFPSIVRAIKQGRIIFSNIRKFIVYQLSYHFGEVLVIAGITFSIFQLPLLPLQLLFLNILLDVFPALAIGIGEGREHVMKNKPKAPNEPIIHKKSWQAILAYGVVIAVVITGAYFFGRYAWGLSLEVCNNIAFFALGYSQLLHVFDMHDHDENIVNNQITRNKYVWMALGLCFILLTSVNFIPGLTSILSIQEMELKVWILIGVASVIPLIINQIIKKIMKV